MGGRRWSKEEDGVLAAIAKSGETLLASMDKIPNRTYFAARNRGEAIGLQFSSARAWTDEERTILARIWAGKVSIKVAIKDLPGRSYLSAKGEAQRLGLAGVKGRKGRTGYSWVEVAVRNVLTNSEHPMTIAEITVATGASTHAVDSALRKGRGEKFRVETWIRKSTFGDLSAKWTVGTGQDAPRPAAQTASQAARKWRARQRIKSNKIDPFASLAMQVAA
ncbi:hypothetical protein B0G84_5010 [Paraburkholderia sp. BL8N3]|nr:hypothetical protein [Paraburkholderia sp. BL8N3]TCK39670.1 hypothetical protein B0G84_5010 [Paraburkholderia sp. BL8N3]